jgi:flagellar biosynthesis/type III secretory pathway M-ring protein FliF/YscJ
MDVQGAGKFRDAIRIRLVTVLLVLLVVVSLIWNVRQYRLIERERQRTTAMERAKAEEEATDERAQAQGRREKKAEEAAANQRMQQLYREIDNLSQISDRLLAQPVRQPRSPSPVDSLGTAEAHPN